MRSIFVLSFVIVYCVGKELTVDGGVQNGAGIDLDVKNDTKGIDGENAIVHVTVDEKTDQEISPEQKIVEVSRISTFKGAAMNFLKNVIPLKFKKKPITCPVPEGLPLQRGILGVLPTNLTTKECSDIGGGQLCPLDNICYSRVFQITFSDDTSQDLCALQFPNSQYVETIPTMDTLRRCYVGVTPASFISFFTFGALTAETFCTFYSVINGSPTTPFRDICYVPGDSYICQITL